LLSCGLFLIDHRELSCCLEQGCVQVLVSGANGYIAAWVIRTLLERGYRVRGTVRSEEKGIHLKKIFRAYNDKFELVVVPDITKV